MAKGKGGGQSGSWPKDQGKGKEIELLLETKGLEAASKVKDVAFKAKDVAPKVKEAHPKAIDPFISQPSSKGDPPPAKA